MTTTPPTDQRLAEIRAHAEEYSTPADWAETTLELLNEIDRLKAENAALDDLRTRAIDKGDQARAELATAMDNYKGEAWQNGRLQTRLAAVLDICDREQRGALRWENPLPVPEWVAEVQRAALGDKHRTAEPATTNGEAR